MILRSLLMVLLMAFAFHVYSQSREDGKPSLPYGTERAEIHEDIQLYPNPAPEYVHIRLGALKSSNVKLSVLNVIGSELNPEVESVNDHEMRVRVKELAPGYYFLTVKDEASRFKGIYKFLKP